MPASVPCNLRLQPPIGGPQWVAFTWSRDGAVFLQHASMWSSREDLVLARRLVPGSYEITTTGETGRVQRNPFTIATTDPAGREIAIKLP